METTGRSSALLIVTILVLFTSALAIRDKKKNIRCRYDKSGVDWGACDKMLHLQTKEAKLVKGRRKCPPTRTYTRPCDRGLIEISGCKYLPVSDWSTCDNSTNITTRTLELSLGNTKSCDNNSVQSKQCKETRESKKSSRRSRRKKKLMRKERRRRRKNKKKRRQRMKNQKKSKTRLEKNLDCVYKRPIWGKCDQTKGLQTAVQELKNNLNSAQCENRKVITLPCGGNKRSRVEKESEEKKKLRERKKKRKDKRKKNKDEISQEPPRMSELYVVPYSTFVMVSWLPPKQDEFGPPSLVDGYQIGYGREFPDVNTVQVNASEVTYKIVGLEPGFQYIISIRAYNQMGVGQALYETVMTRIADDAEPVIMPPIGVRALVLSSHEINVTWVDMSAREETSQRREYYLRYRPLSASSSAAASADGSLSVTPRATYPDYMTPSFKVKRSRSEQQHYLVKSLNPHTTYEFAVLASDGGRNSTWSMMVWNITLEAAPSSAPRALTVIIDPDTPGQVVLTWQPPVEANGIITGYDVSYITTTSDGHPIEERVQVEDTKLSVTLNTLLPGVTYDFSVKAINRKGVGPPLTVNDYQLPGTPAPVPATLTASLAPNDSRAALLVWEIPQKVTANVLGFVILYTSDDLRSANQVDWEVESRLGQALRMAVIEGLKPDTSYHFKVQAHTSQGYGPESNTVLFTTPKEGVKVDLQPAEPPRNIQVSILSSTSVVVSWQDPGMANIYQEEGDDPPTIPTYTVRYRSLDPEPSPYTLANPPFTSLYLLDLDPMTRYEFSVKVNRDGKESMWSKPVINTTFVADFSQPPLIAEIHGRTNSPDVAVLTWQPHVDSKIKEYVVMYTTERWKHQKQWQQKAAVSQNVKQQTFHGLRPETTYFFFVQAMTDLGFGPRSNVISYTTPKEKKASRQLKVPEKLEVMIMSGHSAVVSWHDPDVERSIEKGGAFDRPGVPRTYTLRYRRIFPGDSLKRDGEHPHTLVWPTFPSIFLVDLTPGTRYEFQVRVNRGFQHSEWSPVVINTTFEAAPGSPPQHLKVNMAGDDPTSVLLTWQPPLLPHGNITGYQIYFGIKKGHLEAHLNTSGQELTCHVQLLEPRKRYHFSVEAWNKQGPGPLAPPVKYRTPRVIGNPPTDVTVRPADNPFNAIVTWQPPQTARRRIKYYAITYHTEDGKLLTIDRVDGSELTVLIKELQPSTTYHLRVQAHYRRGAGPNSETARYSIPKELL